MRFLKFIAAKEYMFLNFIKVKNNTDSNIAYSTVQNIFGC